MNYYKTLFYMAWFIRVNGYIPSSSELITFIPIAKNIGIQSIACGLAITGFDGTMSPCSFIPLTSIVLVSKFPVFRKFSVSSSNGRKTVVKLFYLIHKYHFCIF